jgi:hypothetical protein
LHLLELCGFRRAEDSSTGLTNHPRLLYFAACPVSAFACQFF